MRSRPRRTAILVALTTLAALAACSNAQGAVPPIKFVLTSRIGWKVNQNGGNICLAGEKCQPGTLSGEPTGFAYPQGIATAPNGDVYVADTQNARVQEFTNTGQFVAMFGREVDKTTAGDFCTAASKDVCQAGVPGSAPGQLDQPNRIAVDATSGDIYVSEIFSNSGVAARVQKFTASGQFVFEIGKEVNETTKANFCSQEEVEKLAVECTAPAEHPFNVKISEPGSFIGPRALAVSPAGTLYVGDEHRVQEFEPTGKYSGEIPLTSISSQANATVTGLAISPSGTVYVVYDGEAVVRGFDATGEETGQIHVEPDQGGAVSLFAITVDAGGRMAIVGQEEVKGSGSEYRQFARLYNTNNSELISKFTVEEGGATEIAVQGAEEAEELYVIAGGRHEFVRYRAKKVAGVKTSSASCKPGAEKESSDTFDCTLSGEIDPYGVPETEVWFEWGPTCALGAKTPLQSLKPEEAFVDVSAQVTGLPPNTTGFCFLAAAVDQNVRLPEELAGSLTLFDTPPVIAKSLGEPSASFVKSSSVDLFGELNPENTPSEYFFEYAPAAANALASCPGREAACLGVTDTIALHSTQYGRIGAMQEVHGLQPNTAYRYRLATVNAVGEAHGSEGEFRTLAAPTVEAQTFGAEAIGTTTALASGVVRPDGQQGTYSFELGAYNGATTPQYATVFAGPTGTGEERESFGLTALQPGTTYAYRISIHSGYGTAYGQPAIFTTETVPAGIVPPPAPETLPVPPIHFPVATKTCKRGYVLAKHNKCVKKKAKKRKRRRTKKSVRRK